MVTLLFSADFLVTLVEFVVVDFKVDDDGLDVVTLLLRLLVLFSATQ